ncbi:MAG: tryptophan synthase subunit alpha [Clostridia bacterium]|nr:tryptophan synthase subunit alpha [Clostridia bacterium]
MSNRLDNLKRENILGAFITPGDIDIEKTEEYILSMIEGGADFIELGIPFSDPIAEDATIQEFYIKALQNKVNTDTIFECVKRLRKDTEIPVVIITNANPVFSYGIDKFFENCSISGVDAIIMPDVPYEEVDEFKGAADKNGVYIIMAVAPTDEARIEKIVKDAKGFVYATALAENTAEDMEKLIRTVKSKKDIPVITKDENFKCDGLILSNEIVKLIDRGMETKAISRFVKSYK